MTTSLIKKIPPEPNLYISPSPLHKQLISVSLSLYFLLQFSYLIFFYNQNSQSSSSSGLFQTATSLAIMKSHSVSSSPPTSANSSPLARLRRKLSPRKSHDKPPPTNVNSSTSAPNVVDNHNNDLRWVFNYFDENGDGKISTAELQSCITSAGGKLSIEEAEAAIRFCDMDGDGLLGFQDFLCLMTGSVSEEEKTEDLRQAFGLYENEPGSGFITHTSLKRVLSRLGESRSINDCKAIIRTFDLNGDGVLSFNEFSVMMR